MFRFAFLLIFTTSLLNASLVSRNFLDNDLKVLQDLDIDSTFITDYKLQARYKTIVYSKNRYKEHLNDASLFVPVIKEMIKDNGIPDAFLYLVMAESNFTLNAKSKAKAMGLWQFMPGTAKIYGLKQNLYVDERMDIIKSTSSAIKYLKKLHKQFGKWYLAAIAYNCGEGRVIEALTRATLDMYYLYDKKGYKKDPRMKKYREIIKEYQAKRLKFRHLYRVYKEVKKMKYKPGINELLIVQPNLSRQYLPSESQDYIRKIISLALLNNSNYFLDHDNSHLLNMGMLSPIASVSVKGGTHIEDIAKVAGLKRKELLALNLHIKQDIIPPYEKSYDIYIPYSTLTRFNKNIVNMKPSKYYVHVVKRGESLASIGKKYKLPYKIIKNFNKLRSNLLSINQKLIIPLGKSKLPKPDTDYFVKAGDTLASIARSNNIKLAKLMKDNNLKSSFIRIGDKLVIKYD